MRSPIPDTDIDTTSAAAAWAAAEAVRELNLRTQPLAASGLADPGDVYAVLGTLVTTTERLTQAVEQLAGRRKRAVEAGALRAVSGAFRRRRAGGGHRRAVEDRALDQPAAPNQILGRNGPDRTTPDTAGAAAVAARSTGRATRRRDQCSGARR